MSFNGNAFALLEVDDVENLLAYVSTITVKSEVPPFAVDKRIDNQKKASLTWSKPSFQSSSAPKHSIDEKLSFNNRNSQNNRNMVERINDIRQNRNDPRHNKNSRENNCKAAVFKRNNGYMQDGEPSNGLKQSSNQATNVDCNGHEMKVEVIEEEGWQTVKRSKGYKQSNANHRRPLRDVNVKVFDAKQHQLNEVKVFDDKQHNGDGSSDHRGSVQVADEATVEGDETFLKQDKVLPKEEEIERLEWEAKKSAELEAKKLERELDAKKMTLKQYEKLLEEKRKVLESMKTEERRVALDTNFNSMHVVAKKNEEEEPKLNPACDNQKKKAANNKNNKIVLFQPPIPAGRGGRFPRRDDYRNGASSGRLEGSGSHPKAASLPPPSFEDAQQFPALALDGTTKRK